jgi:hypothetical protein
MPPRIFPRNYYNSLNNQAVLLIHVSKDSRFCCIFAPSKLSAWYDSLMQTEFNTFFNDSRCFLRGDSK